MGNGAVGERSESGRARRSPGSAARLLTGALLAAVVAACAPSLHHEHADLQLLTREQMAPNHFRTAYEAVEALRGNWLLARPNAGLTPFPNVVQVYMDNVELGGVAELQNIPMNAVYYIRHFDAIEASQRWGLDHAQGVIYVSTHPLGSAAAPPG